MAARATSPEDSAQERDYYLHLVDGAVRAGANDPYEYRLGAIQAVDAARWAAAADPDDPLVADLLRTAGQLAAAVMTSAVSGAEHRMPIRGELRRVPPGLPPRSLTAAQWADGIWCATAAADACSAVRLARLESAEQAARAPAGEVELARAVAAYWRGDPVGPPLIAALRASDPDAASGAEADRRLDITTPAVAVFRHLLGDDDEALRDSIDAAGRSFASYWNAAARRTRPERALALPLSGLVRLAYELGRGPAEPPAGVPRAVLAPAPAVLTLCPVCASPFDPSETNCGWCGADLARDAPLEQRLREYPGTGAMPCPVCANTNRVTALRCWNCSSPLRPQAR
jgi:hypothetical protein